MDKNEKKKMETSKNNLLEKLFSATFGVVGRLVINFAEELGQIIIMLGQVIYWGIRPPYRLRMIFQQMEFIGVKSLPIIILTGMFTGMVFALQTGTVFRFFNAEEFTGMVVFITLVRELSPVMTALMVTGRAGSAMAAQIGSMKVSQQIDALIALAVDPIEYLVVPRIIASTVMVPVLTMIFSLIGVVACYLIGVVWMRINEGSFVFRMEWLVDGSDITHGLFKSVVFGILLSVIGCYKGYYTEGGAVGVGNSTTQAVVISSVAILVADYVLVSLLI